ncbi:hypothetical protein ANO11243_035440 [Dothideomycetidae sp. 11243]|nr:hypothetical protein ANO11243_035440 [fungal sp. No.11243]
MHKHATRQHAAVEEEEEEKEGGGGALQRLLRAVPCAMPLSAPPSATLAVQWPGTLGLGKTACSAAAVCRDKAVCFCSNILRRAVICNLQCLICASCGFIEAILSLSVAPAPLLGSHIDRCATPRAAALAGQMEREEEEGSRHALVRSPRLPLAHWATAGPSQAMHSLLHCP